MTTKNIPVLATCVVFFVFFSNVVAGAAGIGVFLSDVGEMLTLFAACVCFVVAMLAYERSVTGRAFPAAPPAATCPGDATVTSRRRS